MRFVHNTTNNYEKNRVLNQVFLFFSSLTVKEENVAYTFRRIIVQSAVIIAIDNLSVIAFFNVNCVQ